MESIENVSSDMGTSLLIYDEVGNNGMIATDGQLGSPIQISQSGGG